MPKYYLRHPSVEKAVQLSDRAYAAVVDGVEQWLGFKGVKSAGEAIQCIDKWIELLEYKKSQIRADQVIIATAEVVPEPAGDEFVAKANRGAELDTIPSSPYWLHDKEGQLHVEGAIATVSGKVTERRYHTDLSIFDIDLRISIGDECIASYVVSSNTREDLVRKVENVLARITEISESILKTVFANLSI